MFLNRRLGAALAVCGVLGACGHATSTATTATDVAPAAPTAAELAVQLALENLPDGQTLEWSDADTAAGQVAIERTFMSPDGRHCRDYAVAQAAASGETTVASHSACRDTGGVWRVTAVPAGSPPVDGTS